MTKPFPDHLCFFQPDDSVVAADREFFARYPQRKFRARQASAHEAEKFTRCYNIKTSGDGYWWMLVHNLGDGWHVGLPIPGPFPLQCELSERIVRRAWAEMASPELKRQVREYRRRLRTQEV